MSETQQMLVMLTWPMLGFGGFFLGHFFGRIHARKREREELGPDARRYNHLQTVVHFHPVVLGEIVAAADDLCARWGGTAVPPVPRELTDGALECCLDELAEVLEGPRWPRCGPVNHNPRPYGAPPAPPPPPPSLHGAGQ